MRQSTALGPGASARVTAVALCFLAASGCATTRTTTSIRTLPEPATERLRLLRSEATPLTAHFRQEGHAIVGQLAYTDRCARETVQVIRRQELTETRPKAGLATAIVIVGAALAAIGTGLALASRSADKTVTCGHGVRVKEGDSCDSLSGVYRKVGGTFIGIGAGAALGGVILLTKKPVEGSKTLPPYRRSQTSATPQACGQPAALEGMLVSTELPGAGKWSGRVKPDGSLRIEVNPSLQLPQGATVQVAIDSVPASAAGLLTPGTVLGELTLVAVERGKAVSAAR